MNPVQGPLGPEGVRERMEQIQSRMDQVFGRSFQSYLSANGNDAHQHLWGNIGTKPMNPFGPGASITPKASAELSQMIAQSAKDAGIDPSLFDSLVSVESSYDPSARSKTGALGLCQLMPGTAQALGVSDPTDPQQNLQGGAKYLAQLIRQFNSVPLALAAYNAGPNAVIKYGNQIPPYPETQGYVQKIMDLYNARQTK